MLAQERYDKILEILEKENAVKVPALTQLFNVSIETVRRDLEFLEKEGLLKRVYGGAVLERVSNEEASFSKRKVEKLEEKREIAAIAARYVTEGQSIIIDSGTTPLEFSKEIKKRVKRLTVLTNSLLVALELSSMEKYTIILLGGILRNDELNLGGHMTEKLIQEFHIDTAFLSMGGISIDGGLTDYDIAQVQVRRKMIESAEQVIVLADNSKFNVKTLLKVCDFDDVNMIITDSNIKPRILEKYGSSNVQIITK